MKIGKLTLMAVCFFYTTLAGSDNNYLRKELTKSFFRLPPDAVSHSIGGFNQAFSIGAVDLFINPALLSRHTKKQIQFSNIIDLFSNKFASLAFSMPLGRANNIGIALVGRMNPELSEEKDMEIKVRNNEQYQFEVLAGYSRNFFPFSLGMNVKYFQLRYFDDGFFKNGSVTGIDFGFHYYLNREMSFGFMYQTPLAIKWDDNSREPIPGRFGLGINWMPSYVSENFLRVLFSLEQFGDEPVQMNFGIVLMPGFDNKGLKNLAFRVGLGNIQPGFQNKTSLVDYISDTAPVVTVGTGIKLNSGS
ncbi:MAG: hypothetical protein ACE5GL_04660, partial [Calditrichia bacterium]